MKKHVLLALLLCILLPLYGQTNSELKVENARLKAEIQQLKAELYTLNKNVVELAAQVKAAKDIPSKPGSGGSTPKTTATPTNYPTTIANDEEAKSSTSVQTIGRCKAITQAGSQCKRMASEGSTYCWQHQPATSTKKASTSTTSTSSSGRTIYTGPRGGKYYINSNGNKTYIKR